MKWIKSFFNSLLDLLYPNICMACGNPLIKQENEICTRCVYDLPKTNFHNDPENPIAQLFWGKIPIEQSSAFFYYQKGSKYQHLMHQFKYKGHKNIGVELGKIYGANIAQSPIKHVDLIIPVPLHPSKQHKRGFNQSDFIAHGIAQTLGKPIDTKNLQRVIANPSQTKKTKFQRWENVQNIFKVINQSSFEYKHILLVDDVITTGSTIESCANALLKVKGTKVSVVTLGYAIN